MADYRNIFLSHAHADNALCDPIAEAFTKLGIPNYYDRSNPQVGHNVSEALELELEHARALVVLASPTSLASPWVREEINIFFNLMMHEPDRMLIPLKITPCDLPPRLEARWWVDGVGRPADVVVAEVARALEVGVSPHQPRPPRLPSSADFSRVVDWRNGAGDHTTIADAINAAKPGERILIRKGVYEGGLIIDKPLEIVGDGQLGDVEVYAEDASAIVFTASHGRIANLAVRHTGTSGQVGIDIRTGRLHLEDCDISSSSSVCVAVHDSADPRARHCAIHGAKIAGIHVYDMGRGQYDQCDIFANVVAGISVERGAVPTVRRCSLHGNNRGIFAFDRGAGRVSDCDIHENGLVGIEVKTEGALAIDHCHIHANERGGVYILEHGKGLLANCTITENARSGITVQSHGAPSVRKCKVSNNAHYGVYIFNQGGGEFIENDVSGNGRSAWEISIDCKDKVTRRGNTE